MAASRETEENHWPGYVDALTTMTMMLIFVMTILTVVIFGLSQTASRSMVEKIARIVKIDNIDSHEGAEELAQRVMAKLEAMPSPTMVAEAPPLRIEKTETPPHPLEKPEEPDGERLKSLAEAEQMPVRPARVDAAEALITVAYQSRATGLDDGTRTRIRSVMTEGEHLAKVVELRAFADTTSAISESRRVAFYRLLHLRTELIALGISPERIRARIEDTKGEDARDLVRIGLARSG